MPLSRLLAVGSLVASSVIPKPIAAPGDASFEHIDAAADRKLSNEVPLSQPAKRQDMAASKACPDTNLVRNTALGFWYTTWGKMQCSHSFSEESLQVVVQDVPDQLAQCDVIFYRPYGDLQVRIASATLNIIGAQARAPTDRVKVAQGDSGWRAVDKRVCLLSSVAGIAPVIEAVPRDLVQFAFRSVVLERRRPELVQRACGGSLSLISTEGMGAAVQVTEQRSQRILFISVMEGTDATSIPVQVRVEEILTVTPDNKTEVSYAFLSSLPTPCDISAKMPFAAFGCSSSSSSASSSSASSSSASSSSASSSSASSSSASSSSASSGTASSSARNLQQEGASASRNLAAEASRDGTMPQAYNLLHTFPHCGQPPRGMGRCSAAWAFAAVGAFEKQLCRLTDGVIVEPLSRQRILDCATESAGCDGGSVFDAHAAMLAAGSVVSESCAPFKGSRQNGPGLGRCNPPSGQCARRFSARYPSIAETVYQTRLTNSIPGAAATNIVMGEKAMQAAILMYGAITAAFSLLPDFLLYREGVYKGQQINGSTSLGTHVVQLVGWGIDAALDQKYWIAENSWGPWWGENQDFQRCSVVDCRGPFCREKDNLRQDCSDSLVWQDGLGYGCSWYASQDLGCRMYADRGQMTYCRRTCRNCLPPSPRNGEICGYFRILRGQNTLGIEAAAAHTYVAGLAPAESSLEYLGPTCEDDANWLDAWGKSCSWYVAQDAGCSKYQDIGQRAFCRKTCGTCPGSSLQVRPPTSLAKELSGGIAIASLRAHVEFMAVLLVLFTLC